MRKIILIGSVAVLTMLLNACGQSGPLYLPAHQYPSKPMTPHNSPAPNRAAPGTPLPQHTIPLGTS